MNGSHAETARAFGVGGKRLLAALRMALVLRDWTRLGDVVTVAIPFGNFSDLPADAFKGKVVIDAGNYYPERDGKFPRSLKLGGNGGKRVWVEREVLDWMASRVAERDV